MGAENANSGANAVAVIVLMFALAALYFIPLIVAAIRKVPNLGSVGVINFFLGWTFVGWVVALAMACRSADRSVVVNQFAAIPSQINHAIPTATGSAPAGWFSDPRGSGQLRYWDGTGWTEHLASPT